MFASRRDHCGFALRDLVVVLIVIALVAGVAVILAAKTDEKASRVACADNLRTIGQALLLYSNENKGAFPRTTFDMNSADKVKMFTNWKASNPFAAGGPEANDVTAAYYLLLRTQKMSPGVFRCPSSSAKPLRFGLSAASQRALPGQEGASDPVAAEVQKENAELERQKQRSDPVAGSAEPVALEPRDISNFPGVEYMGYSFANPYPSVAAIGMGFKLNANLGNFIMAADLNPGGSEVAAAKIDAMPPWESPQGQYSPAAKQPWKFSKEQLASNSPNHNGFGQNVLYHTGGVAWQATPFCGSQGRGDKERFDNIYTRYVADMDPSKRGDPIVGPPTDPFDSVLLPTAQAGAAKAAAPGADPVGGSGNR